MIKYPKSKKQPKNLNAEDINHLLWIYHRLRDIHNENENLDYMIKMKTIIMKL